jgi:hypothetical protein
VEFLYFVLVAVIVIWVRYQIGKQKVSGTRPTKSSGSRPTARKSASGMLRFQETGIPPKTDSQGRVIVKVAGGTSGVTFGVNSRDLSPEAALKLAGKPNDDEEFAKSVKVRVRSDKQSQYANSFILETSDGKLIGWILKDDSEQAASVLSQIQTALLKSAPELEGREFTFEVSLRVEGYWDEIGEDGVEEWEPDFAQMEIRIKSPVEIEIE